MKKRILTLIAAVETSILLVAVYFEPSHCVRGHLHGEPFFDGKPTSWWRQELENWELTLKDAHPAGWRYYYERNSTRFENYLAYLKTDAQKREDAQTHYEWMLLRIQHWDGLAPWGPTLLNGDAEAAPVLQALLDDRSPKIRRFVRIGLNMDPEER